MRARLFRDFWSDTSFIRDIIGRILVRGISGAAFIIFGSLLLEKVRPGWGFMAHNSPYVVVIALLAAIRGEIANAPKRWDSTWEKRVQERRAGKQLSDPSGRTKSKSRRRTTIRGR